MKVRSAAGQMWGLNPAMSVWMYRAIVRPSFTWGCLVWVRATYDINLCKLMTKVQRLALTSMGYFRISTPTAGLEVATYTVPLPFHVRQESAMAFGRTTHQTKYSREDMHVFNRPNTVGHRQVVERFLTEIEYDLNDADKTNNDDINPPVQS